MGSLVAFAGCVWVTLVILVTSGQCGQRIWGRLLKVVARTMWALPGGPRCGSAVKYSRRRCGVADVAFRAVWTADMNVSQSVYIRTRRSVRSLLKVHAVGISLTHHVMQSSFCGTEMHLHSRGGRIFYPPRDRLFPRHVS